VRKRKHGPAFANPVRAGNYKDKFMATSTKTKAAERFASLRKRDEAVRNDIEVAARLRSEKVARLRELRLAKEAETAAAKEKEIAAKAEKNLSKKTRNRVPAPVAD
jgi:colicin import membrane protein